MRPVPQIAPYVSEGMNLLKFRYGQCAKKTDVKSWYGDYHVKKEGSRELLDGGT